MGKGTKGLSANQVRALKRSVGLNEVQKKVDAGKANGDERAIVRVGKANTKILTGQEDLTLWSKEELRRGQRRNKNGKWQGARPKVVPKAIHDELVRRTMKDAEKMMQKALLPACKMLASVIEDDDVPARDRIKAASMILDRIMGKTPDKVEIKSTEGDLPWLEAIKDSVITLPEEAIHDGDD